MDTKTHKNITSLAIKTFGNDILINNIDQIVFYSAQPDFDETQGAFKYHFYNPATEKNYAGEYDSALTRYIRYYNMAIFDFKNEQNKYIEYLGRCIHYLVDLNTPVHTYNQDIFDAVINVSSHAFFENKCDELIDNFIISNIPKIDNINYFRDNTIKTIGLSCAFIASILFDKYANIKNKNDVISICNDSIINSIKNTIGIIYKFTLDKDEQVI